MLYMRILFHAQNGFGGGIWVQGRISTLLADSAFDHNTAGEQGGSILIESIQDLVRAYCRAQMDRQTNVCCGKT